MRNYFTRSLGLLALAASLSTLSSSCSKDLDQTPDYLASNPDVVYGNQAQVFQLLARLYSTYAVSGQQGASGTSDIAGIDGSFGNYIRTYWQLQEITTDEAILGWNDGNLPAINTNTWNADNEFVRATFQRIYFQIGLCNEFIRETSDDNLAKRGMTDANGAATIRQYRAEARLLRALSYWHAIDLFGGGPFITENDALVISNLPPYRKGSEMFTYVESELKDLDTGTDLQDPRAVYGRADKAVCWTLLSKLYLNAKVYTGTDRSADALTYADKVLTKGGYSLAPTYANLFLADNDRTSSQEAIFAITFDGLHTTTFGGMAYLVHAPVGRAVDPKSAGINGGWGGLRTKPNLVNLFPGGASGPDARQRLFFTKGQNPNVDTLSQFSSGVLITKFRNVTSTGVAGSDPGGNFPDTDFFMFRLADVKLMYAEALLRGATGGTSGTALQQVNQVRVRSGAAPLASVSVDDILAERGRELYWEGHRRTDLIRFGRYVSGYNWPFKGGVQAGKDIEPFRSIFPIPSTERVLNTNLPQNPGY